jgi:hypothetical protein
MLTNRNSIRDFGSSRGATQHSLQRRDQPRELVIRLSGETVPSIRTTLQTWKEIACELNCSVRTVQRSERTLGLPVERIGKGPRSRVLAFKDELRRWLRNSAKAPATKDVALLQSITDFLREEIHPPNTSAISVTLP